MKAAADLKARQNAFRTVKKANPEARAQALEAIRAKVTELANRASDATSSVVDSASGAMQDKAVQARLLSALKSPAAIGAVGGAGLGLASNVGRDVSLSKRLRDALMGAGLGAGAGYAGQKAYEFARESTSQNAQLDDTISQTKQLADAESQLTEMTPVEAALRRTFGLSTEGLSEGEAGLGPAAAVVPGAYVFDKALRMRADSVHGDLRFKPPVNPAVGTSTMRDLMAGKGPTGNAINDAMDALNHANTKNLGVSDRLLDQLKSHVGAGAKYKDLGRYQSVFNQFDTGGEKVLAGTARTPLWAGIKNRWGGTGVSPASAARSPMGRMGRVLGRAAPLLGAAAVTDAAYKSWTRPDSLQEISTLTDRLGL